MKTKYFILAAIATVGLASCSSDEFLGDNSPNVTQETSAIEGAISFRGGAGNLTRATSNTGTAAQMLDGQFKIYGVKKTNGTPDTYADVFTNYVVWSNTTSVTTSNPDATSGATDGWEYVGTTSQTYGADNTALTAEQYIKYWDYSTNEYHFVAGSPVKHFTYTVTNGEIVSASVAGIAGHINPNSGTAINTDPVYIAAPVKVEKANYQSEVTFQFTRQQAYVRVGVFETIPGYRITAINFYEYEESNDAWKTTPKATSNIVLASKTANYFSGASNATATVNYEWTTPSISGISYASGLTQQKNWYGGVLTGVPATTSTETTIANLYGTDADMVATTGYFTVLPMASAATAQPILVKCDYTLTALDGSETIKIKGATAAIPAAFCKWNPNTSYTYLFKISDNTNGTTGDPSDPTNNPEGLFPITFDATVIAEVNGTEQGYITSVTTPSITTYQEGSVTATGVKYVKEKTIYFTAQNDETGALNTLTALNNATPAVGMVKVYKLGGAATEADLILTRPTTAFTTTIGAAAWSINGQSVESGKWASFTPDATGYYAIEYITATAPAYTYKVVLVE